MADLEDNPSIWLSNFFSTVLCERENGVILLKIPPILVDVEKVAKIKALKDFITLFYACFFVKMSQK